MKKEKVVHRIPLTCLNGPETWYFSLKSTCQSDMSGMSVFLNCFQGVVGIQEALCVYVYNVMSLEPWKSLAAGQWPRGRVWSPPAAPRLPWPALG